jgi:hypothetical protein
MIKTKKGWIYEVTNVIGDCLEMGGICGKKIFWSNETLKRLGIDPVEDDESDNWNEFMTVGEYLFRGVKPDRILKKGTEIQ